VHALACTWRGTAFVSSDGRVNILGPNDFLQHGSVSMSRRGVISFATGCKCIKLYAGSEHFVAVVASSDGGLRVFTWGWGEHGQLGNGSVNDSGPCGVLDLAPHQRVHVAAGAAFVVVVSEEEKFHSSCAHRPNSEVQMQH
jgi:alpha-tubulin suppressor-like RCC1 family protein